MSTIVQCPRCGADVRLPDKGSHATCPKCVYNFDRKRRAHGAKTNDDEERSWLGEWPPWVSPWGVSSFCLATLAMLSATFVGNRNVTIGVAIAGFVAILIGLVSTRRERKPSDIRWFIVGGLANAAVIGMTVYAGGLLNHYWEMDAPVPKADPHQMVAVKIDPAAPERKAIIAGESVDARTQAIQQDEVFLRVGSVQIGHVDGHGAGSYLIVQLRLSNKGNKPFTFEGFWNDKHTAQLKDKAGRKLNFVELRKRKIPAGGVVFESAMPGNVEVKAAGLQRYLDFQLIFEAPTGSDFPALTMELPAAAWGRRGAAIFGISRTFDDASSEPKSSEPK